MAPSEFQLLRGELKDLAQIVERVRSRVERLSLAMVAVAVIVAGAKAADAIAAFVGVVP